MFVSKKEICLFRFIEYLKCTVCLFVVYARNLQFSYFDDHHIFQIYKSGFIVDFGCSRSTSMSSSIINVELET